MDKKLACKPILKWACPVTSAGMSSYFNSATNKLDKQSNDLMVI